MLHCTGRTTGDQRAALRRGGSRFGLLQDLHGIAGRSPMFINVHQCSSMDSSNSSMTVAVQWMSQIEHRCNKKSRLTQPIGTVKVGFGSPWNLNFHFQCRLLRRLLRPCHRSAHGQTCPWTSWHPRSCCYPKLQRLTCGSNFWICNILQPWTFQDILATVQVAMAGAMSVHSPSLAARGALTGACSGVDFSKGHRTNGTQFLDRGVWCPSDKNQSLARDERQPLTVQWRKLSRVHRNRGRTFLISKISKYFSSPLCWVHSGHLGSDCLNIFPLWLLRHPSLTRRRSTVWFDGSRRLAWAKSCQVEALKPYWDTKNAQTDILPGDTWWHMWHINTYQINSVEFMDEMCLVPKSLLDGQVMVIGRSFDGPARKQ